MRREMKHMSIHIGLLQRAVSNAPVVAHDAGARLRIPEPKAYDSARDTKEVENFFFDMEQYFLAANVEDEATKVTTATMYLKGDAKLWWRTKYAEIQANQVRLDTWVLLREAIREQFFPENIEYNARRALRKLEHTGSMQDYVKSFSALMLDIRDMSEKDKLFTFMEGLKPDKTSPAKSVEPQASASGGNDPKEDEGNLGAISVQHVVPSGGGKEGRPPRLGKDCPGSNWEPSER
ncbi:UNVERIFIED_CONTAM: hypothetical protein Sradi_3720900 [Sesamum radiatum]|uniref:Retrotransposon gag domain-containing protein n=1 Tax=Sesamum radiatum TaxID=300843 RepID=A0AAW2PY67_SESRA